MTRKMLAEAKWATLRKEMREVMVETARLGQLISYSELCANLKTAHIHFRSPALVRLLMEIGSAESKAGRPALPAVVVNKQSRMPGAGYFMGAREDAEVSNNSDSKAMWDADLKQVYDYWSKH